MSMKQPSWLQALLADRRKVMVMLSLLAVAMLLWGRLLLKNPPRTAVADPEKAASQQDSSQPDTKPIMYTTPHEVVVVTIPATLSRDVFSPDESSHWRRSDDKNINVRIEKSHDDPTDKEFQRRAIVRAAASGLSLQTTLTGEKPWAVIDDRLIRPGEQINGFTLKRVDSRWVLLESNGILVRLEM